MEKKRLNVIQITVALVSLHYGLGFLFGTSEAVYQDGISGIIYPIMCAFGLFLLSILVPFYHKNKFPLWILFQKKYDDRVKNLTIFLSWFWMIGVVASQVSSTAYIFKTIGIPIAISLLIVILLVSLISFLPIEKLAQVLLCFLIINSTILIYAIFRLPKININQLVLGTITNYSSTKIFSFLGIAIPTILITMLGMDFHQFIVKGKNSLVSIKATILAGFILILLTAVPTVLSMKVKINGILPGGLNGKQLIPYTMVFLSQEIFGIKYFLLPIIIITTIGSCSCLIRIMIQTFQKFEFIPNFVRKDKKIILLINALLIFLLTIRETSLISLIVSFYIIYIVGVFVPFLTLLPKKNTISFKSSTVFWSMVSGSIVSLLVLILSKLELIYVSKPFNLELVMILSGITTSLITLIGDKLGQVLYFIFLRKYAKRNIK